jgi:hypothetical protein
MPTPPLTDEQLQETVDAVARHRGNITHAADALGIGRRSVGHRVEMARRRGICPDLRAVSYGEQGISGSPCKAAESEQRTVDVDGLSEFRIRDVEDAVKKAGVDLDVWQVERIVVNGWDVTAKIKQGDTAKLHRSQNQQVKVWLKRKVSEPLETAVNRLLKRVEAASPRTPRLRLKRRRGQPRRALEPCIMDPHRGLRSFPPAADHEWTPELCDQLVMDAIENILALAEPYAPFEQIFLPIGNDFFHVDGVFHTTTQGTAQPEADSWHHTFIGGEQLAINIVDRLAEVAPVEVYEIPGNHSRQTDFALGRILRAWYRNNRNVSVFADGSPYKFKRYGVNLIGYEHGHSINASRLPALMANERPQDWAETQYREWHLGDQHRKGSAKPSMFEESGVAVEYLPALTGGNEWHRLKGFNHQQRGAMGFVWDYEEGPVARVTVNLGRGANSWMGKQAG